MEAPYPGDDIVRDAVMVYDQTRVIMAPCSDIFPWLRQLGKSRGGWYLPASVLRFLPQDWRAARHINPQWQCLSEGDRIADYSFGDEDYFDVVIMEEPSAVVFQSERYGCAFSWALLLHDHPDAAGAASIVHLRFRGRIQATGLKRGLLVGGGGVMDYLSTAPMLAGLAERVERPRTR